MSLLKTFSSRAYGHGRVVARVRVAVGIWLLILTAILYGYGRGGWWAALLLPAAALHFCLAYRALTVDSDSHHP
jgi:hypothetical protein